MNVQGRPSWRSHVEETFESSHHNAPADQPDHKCANVHGHSWLAEIELTYGALDRPEIGWGPDFGVLKGIIRQLDHKDLNAFFDFPPSAELIAQWIYRQVQEQTGRTPDVVRVHEGRGNMIAYSEQEP